MRVILCSALIVLAAALAGCGSSHPSSNGEADKTVAQILADAQAATATATSVHITGSGLSDSAPLALDLRLVAGKGGTGQITAEGLTFNIIRIGGKAYFKGNSAFWRHFGGAGAVQLLKGRWLEAPATKGDLSSFTPLTDLGKFTKTLLGSHGTLKKGLETKIDGQPAIAIVDKSGGGTLYVATTGSPFPIELTKGAGSKGKIAFDEWNQAVALAAPKNAVDYTKLKG